MQSEIDNYTYYHTPNYENISQQSFGPNPYFSLVENKYFIDGGLMDQSHMNGQSVFYAQANYPQNAPQLNYSPGSDTNYTEITIPSNDRCCCCNIL